MHRLGAKIRELRKKKGIHQGVLAKRAGITQSYLSLIERTNKEPSMAALRSIANALGTSVPLLCWFAIRYDDVKPSKRLAFKVIKPAMDVLINTIIEDDEKWEM